jgi:DNA-binding IclR family transcriptional regulator
LAKQDNRSQTVEKALNLLQSFTLDTPEWSLTDLSSARGLTVPTTYRLLNTLVAAGFLIQRPKTKTYATGPAVMRLAGAFLRRNDLLDVMRPQMENLRHLSGETVSLHWMIHQERLRVLELVSHHPIHMASGVGHTNPLHSGAAGKALLAFMPASERKEYLTAASKAGRLGRPVEAFEEELEQCRVDGYSTSHGEVLHGVFSIATAICNTQAYPVAALSVTGPSERFTSSKMLEIVPQLMVATKVGESSLV